MSYEKMKTESKRIFHLNGDVAIVGMGCVFPGAPDLQTFWQNIVSKVDAITEVSPERWDPDVYYDEDLDAEYRLYCKRGGFLGDLATFNPLSYGIMPLTVDGGEPDQFLALRAAYAAQADAGCLDKPLEWDRTTVIIGRGNYIGHGNCNVTAHSSGVEQIVSILKKLHPEFTEDEIQVLRQALQLSLPKYNHENAPSIIPNITTGRIANRLGCMGANYTLDAACASTLIAAELGVRDLLTGNCDAALIGGIHVCMEVPFLSIFCQLRAMSLSCQIRPFDKKADGLIPGEGVGVVLLKRLEDAERDGDRIYAVIKGIGTSSDGRGASVTAPRVEGEELALRRAYEMAGIDPDTVELIEGHGTATTVGDAAELETLDRVFGERDEDLPPTCALGSVKSMIGHTMPAAGAAGMIKAVLSLYHKVLPPTIHCDEPNPKMDWSKSRIYINAETRPWIHGQDAPRRACVNAFGFGGVNGHVILEEYRGADEEESETLWHNWDSEVFILQAESRQALMSGVQQLQQYLTSVPTVLLKDLAYTLNSRLSDMPYRLSIVATSVEDLQEKLEYSSKRLSDPNCRKIKYINGVFFFEEPLAKKGKLAFLFPGEGSQYLNMLADLCMHFPEVRKIFDQFDRAYINQGYKYLPSQIIFPPPALSDEEREKSEERIWKMDGAIQAVLASNGALNLLLNSLDIHPDVIAGHSTGELSAMFASGMVTLDDAHVYSLVDLERLYTLAEASSDIPEAIMVAVGADYDTVSAIASEIDGDIYVAMDNCPHQVVVVSEEEPGEQFIQKLRERGVIYEKLPFNRAYHTLIFKPVCDALLEHFQEWNIKTPDTPIYSCTTMSPFPDNPEDILELAVEHWMCPVEFRRTIEAMYEAGIRIFVEVGPQSHLTGFIDDILRGREYLAMPVNVQYRSGITQLNYLIGILAAHGVSMCLDHLYKRRSPLLLSIDASDDGKLLQKDATGTMKLDLRLPEVKIDEYLRIKEEEAKQQQSAVSDQTPASRTFGPLARSVGAKEESTKPTVRDYPVERGEQVTLGQDHSYGEVVSSRTEDTLLPDVVTPDESSLVISQYLETMEGFLEVQEEVMNAYLCNGGQTALEEEQAKKGEQDSIFGVHYSIEASTIERHPASNTEYPFVETIVSYIPGQELVALRQLSLDEDIFLYDHTFGGRISVDENLIGLPVIPMTVSMEMMAEAAAFLQPGKVMVGMEQIRASQWIKIVDGAPTNLHFVAEVQASSKNKVKVQIRDLGEDAETDPSQLSPVIEGIMVFGDAYPSPPEVYDSALESEGPCERTAKQVYEQYHLFHGPRFQGVVSLNGSSRHGIKATLEVIEFDNLFSSNREPNMITDAALLDAVGQIFGYWAYEYLEVGAHVMFPIRVDALQIYGPNLSPGERVQCIVRVQEIGATRVRMNADVICADGRLWMRVLGWTDWRFYLPEDSYDFWRFPNRTVLSEPYNELVSILYSELDIQEQQSFECYFLPRLSGELLQEIWILNWMHQILNYRERQTYRELMVQQDKEFRWLYGRMVAKDAVRVYLKKRYGTEFYPADIEIANDEYGHPILRGYWTKDVEYVPAISLSHSADLAIAITGKSEFLGIDVEKIEERDHDFEKMAFAQEEQELLARSSSMSQRVELQTRLWCAKEAVIEALGRGFVTSPLEVIISEYTEKSQKSGGQYGIAKVILRGKLLDEFPEYASSEIVAYVTRYKDYIIAATVGKPFLVNSY